MKKRPLEDWEIAECLGLKRAVDAFNAGKPRKDRISQARIADALGGINQGSVSAYLSGVNALNAKVAGVIAGLINVPVESFSPRLAKEIGDLTKAVSRDEVINVSPTLQPYKEEKEYPLISWIAAGAWAESCDTYQPGDAEEWIASHEDAGPRGYWLEVKGFSMVDPQGGGFQPTTKILVKPEGFDLISGKLYIARLNDTGETTFKQYVRDAGLGYLRPLNPSFKTIEISESVEIIGRVIDAKLPRSLF